MKKKHAFVLDFFTPTLSILVMSSASPYTTSLLLFISVYYPFQIKMKNQKRELKGTRREKFSKCKLQAPIFLFRNIMLFKASTTCFSYMENC